jgi:hypothetical protein
MRRSKSDLKADICKIVEFNKEVKKTDEVAMNKTWNIVSALGHWLNEGDLDDFIGRYHYEVSFQPHSSSVRQ